jgi:DnaJ-class molecular chaperone
MNKAYEILAHQYSRKLYDISGEDNDHLFGEFMLNATEAFNYVFNSGYKLIIFISEIPNIYSMF